MIKEEKEEIIIDSMFLDISNGGVEIFVIDRGFGPTIKIKTSALGNLINTSEIFTDRKSLKELGEMLITASGRKKEYSKDYCHKAKRVKAVEVKPFIHSVEPTTQGTRP